MAHIAVPISGLNFWRHDVSDSSVAMSVFVLILATQVADFEFNLAETTLNDFLN